MNRFLVCILMVLIAFAAQAEDAVQAIELQENDQASCVTKLINQCVPKCKATDDSNCAQVCEENAKNQCRDAGE